MIKKLLKKKQKKLMSMHHNLMVFSFMVFFLASFVFLFASRTMAVELIEEAFMPAKTHETIVNLGDTKDAVGNEIFRESMGAEEDFGQGCFLQGGEGSKIDGEQIKRQICESVYQGEYDGGIGAKDDCIVLNQINPITITNEDKQEFCSTVLGGDRDIGAFSSSSRAPLIVRITKFLLRLVIVLSISMVIYTGLMYIIEASKGAEVKNARDSLMYIIGGVLLALLSLALVNLISSLSISSLNI